MNGQQLDYEKMISNLLQNLVTKLDDKILEVCSPQLDTIINVVGVLTLESVAGANNMGEDDMPTLIGMKQTIDQLANSPAMPVFISMALLVGAALAGDSQAEVMQDVEGLGHLMESFVTRPPDYED